MVKLLPLFLLLLVGCGSPGKSDTAQVPQVSQAKPFTAYGHITPIQLPAGEFFDGWVVPEISKGYSKGDLCMFSTPNKPRRYQTGATNILRSSDGTPILIVKDPEQ